jgi:hypothetical protein
MFICRKTYEEGGFLRKTRRLIMDMWATEDENFEQKENQDEYQKSHYY